jgi:hypothetical protein
MSRLRVLLLVAGAGTLLAGLPAYGTTEARPAPSPGSSAAGQTRALQLLAAASRAARTRSYAGTQYVSTWHGDRASASIADIRHDAAVGTVVHVRPTAVGNADATVAPTTDLDPRLVRLLAAHYRVDLAPDASCTGRAVHVVEARHAEDGAVAGAFWIDVATGLVLRRETYDRSGRLARSSAFTSLTIGDDASSTPVALPAALTADQLDAAGIEELRHQGWQVPASLGGNLELFDARMRTHGGERVLHVSYSDGLSTLSLFAQRGRLGAAKMSGFSRQKLGRAAIWVRPSSPERVVWAGGGRVFTLLSDAPQEAVRAAVTALPHDKAPRTGLFARVGRGLARVGSWLNPFS